MYLLVFHAFLLGILIFKGLAARRLYKSFGVDGLTLQSKPIGVELVNKFQVIYATPKFSTSLTKVYYYFSLS
jgi:hypothetical protein